MSDPLPHYEIFGGVLRSPLILEDLPVATATDPTWTLTVSEDTPEPTGEELGTDLVFGDTCVRAFRTSSGLALVFDDTGRFDVSRDGSRLTWYRPSGARLDAATADLSGRVLALALHAGGVFSLHASAASLRGGGIAFVAPKHYGKSTLCSALVLAGARAISDDTVPVTSGPVPLLTPGVPRLRLWSDSASRLFGVGDADQPRKHLLDHLEANRVEVEPVPFRAGYLLAPAEELPDGLAVVRERIDPVRATMVLVAHAKLGPVLGGSESGTVLAMAAEIAQTVPVYTLRIVRDMSRLPDVVQALQEWHDAPSPAGEA